jgi:aspartate/methionine/tyrosine aminotransferase
MPNRLSQALAAHRASGKPLIDLTVSNPTECGFAYESEAILNALRSAAALIYEPNPKGLECARRAVVQYYAEKGTALAIKDIVLTTSTSEAYSFIFRLLCDPGDDVLIPAPSYPLFDFLADLQDIKLVRYPLLYDHGWVIDFHALEQSITPRTRAVIVVHPNNPTGHFTKTSEIARLNEICSTRGLATIADEVFLDYSLSESSRATFAANSGALTFTLSGLSKISGLPQMKAAWLVISGPQYAKTQALERLEVIADTYLSMNAPIQLAMPAFLERRHSFQKQLLARLNRNLAELDRQLAAQQICSRLVVEGGWYAILRIPATRSGDDFAVELLQSRNISVHPGHFYELPAAGYLVVSLMTTEMEFSKGVAGLLDCMTDTG